MPADGGKVGCLVRYIRWMGLAINADARDASKGGRRQTCAFKEYTRKLSLSVQNVIRPFDGQRTDSWDDCSQCVQHGDADDEPKLRRLLRGRWIDQEQTRMEISGRRQPGAAMTPPAIRLPVRNDP